MLLPNHEQSFIDRRKLSDYCFSSAHPRGKHKAKMFYNKLGLTSNDTGSFIEVIREAISQNDAVNTSTDIYGDRYNVDFAYKTEKFSANIRTIWIIKKGEKFARLVTCYLI